MGLISLRLLHRHKQTGASKMKMYNVFYVGTSNLVAERIVATGPKMAKALAMHIANLKTDAYLVVKLCK